MSFSHRPAKREKTPLVVGIAGPTKSGKTFSAHRVARGLANGGPVTMINAEGAKGHQYADEFAYTAIDITRPYRPERYTEAVRYALSLQPRPSVLIVDSMSHMHQGPGGLLEYHQDELDRLAGPDASQRDRDKRNASSWIKPKAAENEFIYTMLEADCHLILCFRAREKLKWVKGGAPIDLGWQPIAGEQVAFETLFTLMLPPHSKGVPDLAISEMRSPFDKLIPTGQPLSEATGQALAAWAAGSAGEPGAPQTSESASPAADLPSPQMLKKLNVLIGKLRPDHISTLQLWQAMGREPVASEDGILHWSPLRDSLSKAEAHELLDRLSVMEGKLEAAAAGGNYFEDRAAQVAATG